MRRADHITLALVLVAAGYSPAAITCRAMVAPDPVHREATRRDEARVTVTHETERRTNRAAPHTDAELPARIRAVEPVETCETVAPHASLYRAVFLAPPSQRGPPALG